MPGPQHSLQPPGSSNAFFGAEMHTALGWRFVVLNAILGVVAIIFCCLDLAMDSENYHGGSIYALPFHLMECGVFIVAFIGCRDQVRLFVKITTFGNVAGALMSGIWMVYLGYLLSDRTEEKSDSNSTAENENDEEGETRGIRPELVYPYETLLAVYFLMAAFAAFTGYALSSSLRISVTPSTSGKTTFLGLEFHDAHAKGFVQCNCVLAVVCILFAVLDFVHDSLEDDSSAMYMVPLHLVGIIVFFCALVGAQNKMPCLLKSASCANALQALIGGIGFMVYTIQLRDEDHSATPTLGYISCFLMLFYLILSFYSTLLGYQGGWPQARRSGVVVPGTDRQTAGNPPKVWRAVDPRLSPAPVSSHVPVATVLVTETVIHSSNSTGASSLGSSKY